MRSLKDRENGLAISTLSRLEIFRNTIDKASESYFLQLVNYLHEISVDTTAIMNGVVLSHAYRKNKITKDAPSKSVDLIIAGTALSRTALVLTANRRDFPAPFWKTIERYSMVGQAKDREGDQLINVFLLEFDATKLPTDVQIVRDRSRR